MIATGLSAAFISFFVSTCISRLMVHAGLNDVPVARSSHQRSTPTAGGIGVLCGMAAGFISLFLFGVGSGGFPDLPAILSLCFFIAIIGLYDDLYSPSTALKFGIFVGTAVLLIYVLGPVKALLIGKYIVTIPVFIAVLGTILWIFVSLNSVNFMDGANGLMPGCMSIAFAGLAALALKLQAPQTFWLCLVAMSSLLGFLPLNFRRSALIFAGDTGALLCGFTFGAAVLLIIHETSSASVVCLGALILLPFFADVLLTLLSRLRRRENLLLPHREHLYQRAILSGLSHRGISLLYYTAFAACAALAIVLSARPSMVSAGFMTAIIVSIGLYYIGARIWPVKGRV